MTVPIVKRHSNLKVERIPDASNLAREAPDCTIVDRRKVSKAFRLLKILKGPVKDYVVKIKYIMVQKSVRQKNSITDFKLYFENQTKVCFLDKSSRPSRVT